MLIALLETIREWVQSVLTNFYNVYLGYVTPQMFGAKGDGVTDDTEAFKKVFAHKGLVRIPKGTYLVTAGAIAKNVKMPSQLHIVGEGYEDSIIKLVYPDNTKRHGFILYGDNTNLTLENFAIVDEKHGDDPVFIDSENGQNGNVLLMPKGVFTELTFDGLKLHTGGDSNYLGQYTVMASYLKCSANTLVIKNCVFENFTNRQWGSCLWYEAWDDIDKLPKHIEDIIIHDNIFRHTCSDEALAIYSSTNNPDNTDAGYTNVTIQNNQMLHRNFNGECHTTSYTISVNNTKVATAKTNVLVQDNKFVIDKCGGAPMHSTGGRVIFEGNQIVILSAVYNTAVEGGKDSTGFVLMRTNQATVRNNHFIGRAPFTVVEGFQSADVVFEGNIYDVYGGNVRLNISQPNTGDESTPHKLIFRSNTINADSDKSCIVYVYPQINQKQVIVFEENRLTCGFGQSLGGKSLIVRNNLFNYLTPTTPTSINWYNYVASDVRWIDNENVVLKFYDIDKVTAEKKFTYFEYVGTKDGLYISGGDTEANKNKIFENCKLVYSDDTNNKVDKISALPTPTSSYVGYIYLLTGTQTGYTTGLTYKCIETSTNKFEWKPIADLITRSEMEQAITQNPITKDEVLNYLLKGNN